MYGQIRWQWSFPPSHSSTFVYSFSLHNPHPTGPQALSSKIWAGSRRAILYPWLLPSNFPLRRDELAGFLNNPLSPHHSPTSKCGLLTQPLPQFTNSPIPQLPLSGRIVTKGGASDQQQRHNLDSGGKAGVRPSRPLPTPTPTPTPALCTCLGSGFRISLRIRVRMTLTNPSSYLRVGTSMASLLVTLVRPVTLHLGSGFRISFRMRVRIA